MEGVRSGLTRGARRESTKEEQRHPYRKKRKRGLTVLHLVAEDGNPICPLLTMTRQQFLYRFAVLAASPVKEQRMCSNLMVDVVNSVGPETPAKADVEYFHCLRWVTRNY